MSIFVRNGEQIRTNEPYVQEFNVWDPDQTSLRFALIAADSREPLFKTDEDVRELSFVVLPLAGTGMGRGAKVEMRFGETEVVLTAVERGRENNRVECRGQILSGAGEELTMEALCMR